MNISEIKKKVCDAGKQLLQEGYVSGTWGNISIRIDETQMAITLVDGNMKQWSTRI